MTDDGVTPDYEKPPTNPEPPDKTVLVVCVDGEATLIWRNDAMASEASDHPDDRWFDMQDLADGEPGYRWPLHLKYADWFAVIDPAAQIQITR